MAGVWAEALGERVAAALYFGAGRGRGRGGGGGGGSGSKNVKCCREGTYARHPPRWCFSVQARHGQRVEMTLLSVCCLCAVCDLVCSRTSTHGGDETCSTPWTNVWRVWSSV
jgi:hypothetical protein